MLWVPLITRNGMIFSTPHDKKRFVYPTASQPTWRKNDPTNFHELRWCSLGVFLHATILTDFLGAILRQWDFVRWTHVSTDSSVIQIQKGIFVSSSGIIIGRYTIKQLRRSIHGRGRSIRYHCHIINSTRLSSSPHRVTQHFIHFRSMCWMLWPALLE